MKKLSLALMILAASTLMAGEGASLYNKCAGCHGAQAEKKALNKSQVIQGWDKAKLVTVLNGYKDGSYGGAMKGLMRGQVASYNDKQIEEVSEYISKLK
jgi:cytochrome c553